MSKTPEQFKAALEIVTALGDVIKTLGSIPVGVLFNQVGMSAASFDASLRALIDAGKVRRQDFVLTWIGDQTF